jgi:hypothetical protein
MNKTVTPGNTYSATELAEMRLPKFPTTRKSWYEIFEREKWEFVEVPGKGPGGLQRKYKPSPEVLALIEQRQRGALPPAPAKAKPARESQSQAMQIIGGLQTMTMAQAPASVPQEINQHIQWMCLDACLSTYGPKFAAENVALQLEYATDLYNKLVRLATIKVGDKTASLEDFNRLDAEEMATLLGTLLKLSWIKPYRPVPEIPPGAESYSW